MRVGGALLLAAMSASAGAVPAAAQELRDFCGDRPGLGTSACTVDKGHVQAEIGLGDWTRDTMPDSRTDTILVGDATIRAGIGDTTELRVGWTAYGHERTRDRTTGEVERTGGVGDVTLGFKQNFKNPDGSGLSIAALPFVTLPVGRSPAGSGAWGAGLIVPVDYELSKGVQLQLTPEVDAKPDENGNGRHLAYSGVVGLDIDIVENLAVDLEMQALRDREPEQHQTMLLASAALEFQTDKRTQLDLGTVAGLNHQAPDIEVYAGISHKF